MPSQAVFKRDIGVCVLGSTGSIGVSTLDVLAKHPEKFRVIALTANTQVERLLQQCIKFRPEFAVMVDPDCAKQLEVKIKDHGIGTKVSYGVEGLEKVASLTTVQYVMAAIVGAAGLRPALAAVKTGKRILLANKEALVMSGKIFMEEVSKNGAELLPIDSEHNAIFQCMPLSRQSREMDLGRMGIRKILLTASGGPFRLTPLDEFSRITPEQACAHPNWKMGRKISVDSATMMNKGLEMIEACWLFNASIEQIQVVLHPQSVIHSMVAYTDGSVLAQLGNPDMRIPIAHALAWPERMESGVDSLDIFEVAQLNFEEPDLQRFPCLGLAMEAMNAGGTSSAILSAANEVAVQAFLDKQLGFTSIPAVIEYTLDRLESHELNDLDIVLEDDGKARQVANNYILRSIA